MELPQHRGLKPACDGRRSVAMTVHAVQSQNVPRLRSVSHHRNPLAGRQLDLRGATRRSLLLWAVVKAYTLKPRAEEDARRCCTGCRPSYKTFEGSFMYCAGAPSRLDWPLRPRPGWSGRA